MAYFLLTQRIVAKQADLARVAVARKLSGRNGYCAHRKAPAVTTFKQRKSLLPNARKAARRIYRGAVIIDGTKVAVLYAEPYGMRQQMIFAQALRNLLCELYKHKLDLLVGSEVGGAGGAAAYAFGKLSVPVWRNG